MATTTAQPIGCQDGTSYTSRNPYQDSNSNSLADVAFKFWATDLRTDLDDNVPSYVTDFSGLTSDQYFNPKNDPSSWQHMVNFTVGLGLTPFLANTGLTWGGNTYAGSYTDIVSGTKSWPTTSSSGVDGNVADLWPAAINSRGKFYSAEDPSALVTAFQEIVNTISTIAASGGGAGLSSNTTQIDQEGALIFEAKFNADWSGRLLARPVQTDGSLGTEYWDAGHSYPLPTRGISSPSMQMPRSSRPAPGRWRQPWTRTPTASMTVCAASGSTGCVATAK